MSIGIFPGPTILGNVTGVGGGLGRGLVPPIISNHSTPKIFHGFGVSGSDPSNGVFTSAGIPVGQGKMCLDLNERQIPSGVHYVPGPDECTLCVCENGGPKWCKAVLCAPPQDCKSFRVGTSCCDFTCLDDTLNKKGNGEKTGGPFNGPLDLADVVPKIIVVAITAILSLSLLLFLIHRLRQKQIQGRLNSSVARRCDECDDTRSLDFSMDYFDRGPPPPQYLAWWKPPSSYFPPRGEAPPPYEEAIASTSNCLPMTFTNAYTAAVPIPVTSDNNTVNNGIGSNNQEIAAGAVTTATENGIATTSLTTNPSGGNTNTTNSEITLAANKNDQNNVEPPKPEGAQAQGQSQSQIQKSPRPPSLVLRVEGDTVICTSAIRSSASPSLINKESQPKGKKGAKKRQASLSNTQVNQEDQPGPSSRLRSRLNGTEDVGVINRVLVGGMGMSDSNNIGRNGGSASASVLPVAINDPRFPLRGFINSNVAASNHIYNPNHNHPLLVPPGYDDAMMLHYGRDYFRHSLTLPRRVDILDGRNEYTDNRNQQRFSLQFNIADHWSSASSSTLSLSTPNSPNGIGRPPSLSSSSSSNVSNSHV